MCSTFDIPAVKSRLDDHHYCILAEGFRFVLAPLITAHLGDPFGMTLWEERQQKRILHKDQICITQDHSKVK